jgi:beta-galactosidase
LVFQKIAGKAQIWQGKTLLGKKDTYESGPFTVALPPGDGSRMISLQIEGQPGQAAGLGGEVIVEAAKKGG